MVGQAVGAPERVLVIKEGPEAGQRFEIAGELVIGREGAACNLSDDEVSRRHALVRTVGGDLVLEDCGSTNGTWLNGARVNTPTVLREGDLVRVGETTIELELSARSALASQPHMDAEPRPVPSAEFAPPSTYRRRRIESRDLRVEFVTFAIVAATVVGLILYFALR